MKEYNFVVSIGVFIVTTKTLNEAIYIYNRYWYGCIKTADGKTLFSKITPKSNTYIITGTYASDTSNISITY